ncbi:LysR family transcriptional regulator [Pseudomaricurvus alkylphenolicus]|uniref:LysR substrate-binding domain-containing protein n=1 Tax=Pseudomaricurvus alkylphenolicus TaxID=1306991 RepID=UPI001423089C|nr:LysR substrate-binding domain-containing protein [Pseudomaricurvus alkylphenolicus]NIB39874.1 LysR family transcriptional regulator [Pseudomaricurvus alkylphenolicus]
MSRRFGKLPPLSALEGFEAAARLKSFSLAAEELNITQSAVSHQIRSLEEFFGLDLFNRVGRSVEPTVAGLDFLHTATQALDVLSKGKRRLDFYYRPGSVVFGTSAAFASKWLMPRYDSLREWFPEVQPWLFTTEENFDLETQEVDLAIWYGHGQWPGVESQLLFHDVLTPLYAPNAFSHLPTLEEPDQLQQFPLLHDERPDDWLSWFQRVELQGEDRVEGCVFSDSGLMLECAANGQGVALGSLVLASDMIEQGRLVQPFSETVVTEDAYYLVYDSSQPMRPSVARARDWLLDAAKGFASKWNTAPQSVQAD